MDIDPHTIQQILMTVREQLRCPQCRKRIDVRLDALKVLNNQFAVIQAKCPSCSAHIMLHASIVVGTGADAMKNASSRITVEIDEVKEIERGLQKYNGSFTKLFGNS